MKTHLLPESSPMGVALDTQKTFINTCFQVIAVVLLPFQLGPRCADYRIFYLNIPHVLYCACLISYSTSFFLNGSFCTLVVYWRPYLPPLSVVLDVSDFRRVFAWRKRLTTRPMVGWDPSPMTTMW